MPLSNHPTNTGQGIGGHVKASRVMRPKKGNQYQGLTPEQKNFCSVYLVTASATKAYERSYPGCSSTTARANGNRLLKKAHVVAQIQRLQSLRDAQTNITAASVVKHLWSTATADAREMFDSKGNLLPVNDMPEAIGKSIQSMDLAPTKAGLKVVRIQLVNKAQQTATLAKVMQLYDDKPKVGINIDLRKMDAGKLEQLESQLIQALETHNLKLDEVGNVSGTTPTTIDGEVVGSIESTEKV